MTSRIKITGCHGGQRRRGGRGGGRRGGGGNVACYTAYCSTVAAALSTLFCCGINGGIIPSFMHSLFMASTAGCMQALAELLKVTHRGYFIPPRPEKNPVEGQRASNDFVELRRHALEKYLIQLASHPAIVQGDVSTLHNLWAVCLR